MKGLVTIWRRMTFLLLIWATGSFALSQGESWEAFKEFGTGGTALVCFWGLLFSAMLSLGSFLLAAAYALQSSHKNRLLRVPPIADDLDETAGAGIFRCIQLVVIAICFVWPLYCIGHFALAIKDVPLYTCTVPAAQGCSPDRSIASSISQWHFEFPFKFYRFGVDDKSSGVDFIPFVEPSIILILLIAVAVAAVSFFLRLLRFAASRDQ